MASPVTRRRSWSQIESEQNADSTRFDPAVSPTNSDGSKRMRLRGGRGEYSQLDIEDENDDDETASYGGVRATNAFTSQANGSRARHEASSAEFSPGAIVRVLLQNFVTYERAEFFPGPSLNMVIGPNGTGKSSLVCAICLGLGYPASVLGRATSFGEFVKHGKEYAVVEIELQKRPQDRSNYVVRLKINREENTRQFWLNDSSVPQKRVQSLIQALRIQIDNLCQFLPQEKVAEFAGLNPVELLGRTLQAAAPQQMIVQQLKLKDMFKTQKQMQREFEADAEKLSSWVTRQQGLEADVERLRERDQIKATVAELKEFRVIADYNHKKEAHAQVKEAKKRAQRHQRQLEERCKPSLEDVTKKQAYKTQIGQVLQARVQRAKDLGKAADEALEAVENVATEIQNKDNERTAALASFTKKKQELGSIRSKITDLEHRSKDGTVQSFNAAEYNHNIRAAKRRADELEEERKEIEAERERVLKTAHEKKAEKDSIGRELTNLNSQEGQRLERLNQLSQDAYKAYKWLQEHKNDFEKEVFGPPMLTCSVKDKGYSDHVQAILQKDDFLCFIAQTKNDHKKLTDQFYNVQNLAVAVRTITSDLSLFRSPLSRENLGQLGLDGYALDYLDGPSPVLAMLCSEKKIHLTGVSLNEVSEQQYQKLIDGQTINAFVTGKTLFRITRRREYGPGATSTVTRTVQRGKIWTDESVDGSMKASLEQQMQEIETEISQIRIRLQDTKEKRNNVIEQITEANESTTRLETEKKERQTEFNAWKNIPVKIEREKKNALALEKALRDDKERLSSFADEKDMLQLEKVKLVIRHQESLRLLREAVDGVTEARVRQAEADSDLVALKERNTNIIQRLAEERQKFEELAQRFQESRDLLCVARDKAQEVFYKYTDEQEQPDLVQQQRLIDGAAGRTVEDIDEDIDIEIAKLECIQDADPGVLRDFEKRARDIEELKNESANRQANMEQLNEQIRALRETWEPGLDELIGKINDAFSYNFEQISCAGEVGVHKDEDFDKWAVDIKVKFRENETLQKLDQHRQSGGERAVSTIFYLMSLQSMAQSPFRVVDEINQGMDPRNERMVHERMVEIACREHTSQYFLITPKLLSGLRYDERMKVLCIASGQHMPNNGSQLDFSKCVTIKRSLLAAASA